jgi:small-conductance mechanosensitive channel
MDPFQTLIYDIPVFQWLLAFVLGLLAFALLLLLRIILLRWLSALSQRTVTNVDDFLIEQLKRTAPFFLFMIAMYIGSLALALPVLIQGYLRDVLIAALLIQSAYWVTGLITFAVNRKMKSQVEDAAASVTTLNAFGLIAKIFLWSVVILMLLQNVTGLKLDALVASLGIGGIAVALAVQNVLGDLFASLSIALDKPFVIGDFVIIGEFQGTVEHIGLKSTRLRSLSGEQLVFSNSDMLSSRIRNYKRMMRRRILFTLAVVYGTPAEKLARIPEIVREIIESQECLTFDRAHFKTYGPYSLDFEVVYFVESAEISVYLDRQQNINLEIYRRFAAEDIQFAYPTQTLILDQKTGNSFQKSLDAPRGV